MKHDLKTIGFIKTPYTTIEECPNNTQSDGPLCQIILDDEYLDGLSGLEVGQQILVLYWFENVDRSAILQGSGKGGKRKGTFALRSPHRPNPVGVAVLPIEAIDSESIAVKGLDCLNGTPLVDIKPAIMREVRC